MVVVMMTIKMNKSGRMRWEGHAARIQEKRGAYTVFAGQSKGKSPFGRPKIHTTHSYIA
jgi:hypothetical protein